MGAIISERDAPLGKTSLTACNAQKLVWRNHFSKLSGQRRGIRKPSSLSPFQFVEKQWPRGMPPIYHDASHNQLLFISFNKTMILHFGIEFLILKMATFSACVQPKKSKEAGSNLSRSGERVIQQGLWPHTPSTEESCYKTLCPRIEYLLDAQRSKLYHRNKRFQTYAC